MHHQKGFSLIELAVVVSLAAVLMVFIIPALSSFSNTYQLTVAAQSVASELQVARYLAVSRNEQTQIDYLDQSGGVIPPGSIPPSSSPDSRLSYIQSYVHGVRVSSASTGNPLRPNTFLPPGVYLTDLPDNQIKFHSRGASMNGAGTIEVQNGTGGISLYLSSMGRLNVVDERAN